MTAVLTETRPVAAEAVAVVPAPAVLPAPARPAARPGRYWDHEVAAWRPCPVRDGR